MTAKCSLSEFQISEGRIRQPDRVIIFGHVIFVDSLRKLKHGDSLNLPDPNVAYSVLYNIFFHGNTIVFNVATVLSASSNKTDTTWQVTRFIAVYDVDR